MGSCAAPSAKGDDKFITTDYLQQCLTDIKSHPNGNAVQRRDIIGTNGGKSDFWKRVLEDYKTRQVVFDAKNFEELGPSEYRQL
ncbi:hypothetical protein, partial [Escherichia coli]